jgi:hypothetical protein
MTRKTSYDRKKPLIPLLALCGFHIRINPFPPRSLVVKMRIAVEASRRPANLRLIEH